MTFHGTSCIKMVLFPRLSVLQTFSMLQCDHCLIFIPLSLYAFFIEVRNQTSCDIFTPDTTFPSFSWHLCFRWLIHCMIWLRNWWPKLKSALLPSCLFTQRLQPIFPLLLLLNTTMIRTAIIPPAKRSRPAWPSKRFWYHVKYDCPTGDYHLLDGKQQTTHHPRQERGVLLCNNSSSSSAWRPLCLQDLC